MATTAQTNGIPPSSSSQPQPQSQNTIPSSGTTTVPNTQATNTTPGPSSQPQPSTNNNGANGPSSPTTLSSQEPRPRDARTIELLLTSQGVTSFENRVPLLLLDFAYRHTSSILNDALHLSGDPYTTHAGSKPSGSSGAVPMAAPGGDATVSNSAIAIAIASRQAYQFRGGSGGGVSAGGGGGGGGGSSSSSGGGVGGGGASKEWLQELARERNKVALPRVLANEWGVRLPNERFVLSGQGWGLREQWGVDGARSESEDDDDDDDDDDEDGDDAMEGLEGGDGQKRNKEDGDEDEDEGGGLDEFLGDDMVDEDMEGME